MNTSAVRPLALLVGLIFLFLLASCSVYNTQVDAGHQAAEAGRLADAQQHFEAALALAEESDPEGAHTAYCLTRLAMLHEAQGRYALAESLYQRSLAIREKVLDADDPRTAITLGSLANLYREQGRYDQAAPLFQKALAIQEKVLGPDHPDTATTLNNLALLHGAQGRDDEAEVFLVRALAAQEKAFGPEHPDTATSLNNLVHCHVCKLG